MELLIWGKGWGLPSIDPESLLTLSYCKFAEVPVEIKLGNNNWRSPTGSYPVLVSNSCYEAGAKRIIKNLKDQGFDLDLSLKLENQSESLAYTFLVEKKLSIALQHAFWINTTNFLKTSRPSWCSILPFPLSMYQPIRKRNAVSSFVENSHAFRNMTEQDRNEKIVNEGKECLNTLSHKLGNKDYFFGDKPSSLDALVFSQLAYLLYVPFSSSNLQNHAKACPNLVKYCQRIIDEYFPDAAIEISRLEREESERQKQKVKESMDLGEFPNRNRNILLAAGVVAVSMLFGALGMGFIHVEFIDLKTTPTVGKSKVK